MDNINWNTFGAILIYHHKPNENHLKSLSETENVVFENENRLPVCFSDMSNCVLMCTKNLQISRSIFERTSTGPTLYLAFLVCGHYLLNYLSLKSLIVS